MSEHADVAVLTEIEPRQGLHLQKLCESHLVDQRLGRPARAAAGDRVDDAEGVEERIDGVDHQQEVGGGRQQRVS